MTDPRAHNSLHLMEDIVFISVAAIICGAENWHDIEEFGVIRQDWLEEILELPYGIPSHDTFNRFFSALNPQEFEAIFRDWTEQISQKTQGDFIGIDGKTMRGTKGSNFSAAHIVSAWSDSNDLVLAQLKTEAKSNEITAIPQLLEVLLLQGNIVTIDAMGCQREIAQKIIAKGGDYILALKENQKELYRDTLDSFRFLEPSSVDMDIDYGHGRIETRKCFVIDDLSMLLEHQDKQWEKLTSIIKIESERFFKTTGEIQTQTRYYISSISDAEIANKAIRRHWGIENKLHWTLDMSFNEDYARTRTKNAAENFALINKIALNLIRKNKTSGSIRGNRKAASWSKDRLVALMKT